jgi:hypothetical protein
MSVNGHALENNFSSIQKFAVIPFLIALARHTGAACAAHLIMPSFVRVIFAHPTDAEANRAICIHVTSIQAPLNHKAWGKRASRAGQRILEGHLARRTNLSAWTAFLFRRLKSWRCEPFHQMLAHIHLPRFSEKRITLWTWGHMPSLLFEFLGSPRYASLERRPTQPLFLRDPLARLDRVFLAHV